MARKKKNDKNDNLANKIIAFIFLIAVVSIVGSYLGLSNETIETINQFIISFMIGFVFSTISGWIVESFTGDFLKKITLTIHIYKGFSISISVFFITTFIVKILLFGW